MTYPLRTSITIRAAGPADREACVRLLTAQLVEHHLPADPAGIARGVDLALAPHSPAWLLLAEREGTPVGIVLANLIVRLVVPEARRRGVTTAFLDYFPAEGRRRGVRAVELEVVPTQAAAFALYRGRGFEDVHRQRTTWDLT